MEEGQPGPPVPGWPQRRDGPERGGRTITALGAVAYLPGVDNPRVTHVEVTDEATREPTGRIVPIAALEIAPGHGLGPFHDLLAGDDPPGPAGQSTASLDHPRHGGGDAVTIGVWGSEHDG